MNELSGGFRMGSGAQVAACGDDPPAASFLDMIAAAEFILIHVFPQSPL
jgi:hypothetical protein